MTSIETVSNTKSIGVFHIDIFAHLYPVYLKRLTNEHARQTQSMTDFIKNCLLTLLNLLKWGKCDEKTNN